MASPSYWIDLESLQFHAPPGDPIPSIVTDFYEWVGGLDDVHLGHFRLVGDRVDDHWVEDGSRVASSFVCFLATSDGSRIGWWRPEGEALARAPVVMLGGEGEFMALGRDTEDFFARWAARRIDVYDLFSEDEDGNDEVAGGIAALSAWLAARSVSDRGGGDDELEATRARLEKYFRDWSARRNAFAKDDPAHRAFAAVLKDLIGLPPADKPWKTTFADVIVTGTRCQAFATMVGKRPLPVTPNFEAAVRAFREQDARELPEAGLWYRASFKLDGEGILGVQRSYVEEPNPNEIQLDDEGLRQDFARLPRSPYWTPAWLRDRL